MLLIYEHFIILYFFFEIIDQYFEDKIYIVDEYKSKTISQKSSTMQMKKNSAVCYFSDLSLWHESVII